MEKYKKIHVTVAIAAYNAEKNIVQLLKSLIGQSQSDYILDRIIVYSDCSSDHTASLAHSLQSELVRVVSGQQRRGFAGVVKYLLGQSDSDLTVLLNDDIRITDERFISHLVESYKNNDKAGLICGNPQPVRSKNFIAQAIASSFRAYYRMATSFKEGNNMHTYDGKVMALSREFKDSLQIPEDLKKMGNVDSYIYFACLSNGFSYQFVKQAVVHYLCPTTIKDYLRWYIRNNANESIMNEQFGDLVDKEHQKPRIVFLYYLFVEFLKNPVGCIFLFGMGFYIRHAAKKYAQDFKHTWDVVSTTKELAHV